MITRVQYNLKCILSIHLSVFNKTKIKTIVFHTTFSEMFSLRINLQCILLYFYRLPTLCFYLILINMMQQKYSPTTQNMNNVYRDKINSKIK